LYVPQLRLSSRASSYVRFRGDGDLRYEEGLGGRFLFGELIFDEGEESLQNQHFSGSKEIFTRDSSGCMSVNDGIVPANSINRLKVVNVHQLIIPRCTTLRAEMSR
jgi:hypothetical protein